MSLLNGDEDVGRPRRGGLRAGLVLGVLALLVVAAYVALYRYADDKVPLGTHVEGVSIGGLAPAAAEARMRARFEPALHRTLTFVHEGERYSLVPARAGVRVDYAATVRAAGGGSGGASPGRLWDFVAGGGPAHPVVRFDRQPFDAALLALTRKVGRPEVEGGIEFIDGRAHPVYSRTGLSVNRPEMKALIVRMIFDSGETADRAELPISQRQPYVNAEEVDRAMRRFGRPAMSGPVTVVIGGQRIVATPELFGRVLKMVPNGHRLVPLLDGDRLVKALRPAMRTVGDKPRNARIRIVGSSPGRSSGRSLGHPQVVPAVIGASFDSDELARKFLAHLTKSGSERRFTLHAAVRRPKVSTADVRAYGIRKAVGSATVPAPDSGGLVGRLDHHLIRPGRTMTVSDVIGSESTELASAVFDAALAAGYPIDDRVSVHRHHAGLRVGREAADVTIRNNGDHAVLVDAEESAGSVTVTLWSTRDRTVRVRTGSHTNPVAPPVVTSDDPDCRAREGRAGFTVAVRRTVTREGSRTHDSFLTTYDPVPGVRCD